MPRVRMGEQQEIETLINEEALLLAMFLRNEKQGGFLEMSECCQHYLADRFNCFSTACSNDLYNVSSFS